MTTPTLREMFRRFLNAEEQTRAAVSVEYFGWLDLFLGSIILLTPNGSAALLGMPPFSVEAENIIRLVGLLVGGLGMLYVVSGRLNAQGFVFASLLDRPLVPVVMAVLWYQNIVAGPMALAFSISDFGGFLWTVWAWRADVRLGPNPNRRRLGAKMAASFFAFVGGVVRNARPFHPDGRVFRASLHSVNPSGASLARAADQLAGAALLRIGMGVMKRGMPAWLADRIPDAPSIAARFYTAATADEIRLERRPGEDLDVLATAGGDRLWKLVWNLATGGGSYGLHQLDYFRNVYYADVPYRIDGGKLDVWLRMVPDAEPASDPDSGSDWPANSPVDGAGREAGLSTAVARHATFRIEAQPVGGSDEPFVAFARIRLEEEIAVDQEALHFDPMAGRGFVPHGLLTDLRRSVYPASAQSRPGSAEERMRRESDGLGTRLSRFFQRPSVAEEGLPARDEFSGGGAGGTAAPAGGAVALAGGMRRWFGVACYAVVAVVVLFGVYLGVRLTRDRAVDYAADLDHFKYGSTGGERLTGVPYWLWIALPELFPEELPDKTPGRGYASMGMIYEDVKNGKKVDPRYDLPVGMSMRNVRGIDVVYLNCAVCHTGTVRDAPGGAPRVITGMPANTFNLGAWGKFLTSIPKSQKFTPERLLDQIRLMQDHPNRRADQPDLINRLIFRFYAVYLMRERLLMLGDRLSFIDKDSWGPGRVDTFNAPKALLNFPMDPAHSDPKELVGNVDFPSVWHQGPRKGMQLHWDGNNTSVDERNLSAAFGTGAYPPTLDSERVLRTAKWLETAQPPQYPYPIDGALASQGVPVYREYCAGCHGAKDAPFRNNPPKEDELVGTIVPLAEIGTDRWRLDSYTWLLAVNQSTLYAGYEKDWGFEKPYPQRFTHFRKTQGYANSPLDGIWLRAPYLHNGSVPNLRELLEPAGARTGLFYRGNDVYDPQNVGFVSNLEDLDGRRFFRFDTAKAGNGNGGHDGPAYGTNLPAEKKRALLEYLKTF